MASDEAAAREAARHESLTSVGVADEGLDARIDLLADALIGAGVTSRAKPFEGLSRYSPSALAELACAKEVAEAAKLTAAVRKRRPPKVVLAACDAVDRTAAEVKRRLAAFGAPQKEWAKAIARRDDHLASWQKSLTRLRVLARASLIDDAGAYEALVAPPEGMLVPRARRTKKPPNRIGNAGSEFGGVGAADHGVFARPRGESGPSYDSRSHACTHLEIVLVLCVRHQAHRAIGGPYRTGLGTDIFYIACVGEVRSARAAVPTMRVGGRPPCIKNADGRSCRPCSCSRLSLPPVAHRRVRRCSLRFAPTW